MRPFVDIDKIWTLLKWQKIQKTSENFTLASEDFGRLRKFSKDFVILRSIFDIDRFGLHLNDKKFQKISEDFTLASEDFEKLCKTFKILHKNSEDFGRLQKISEDLVKSLPKSDLDLRNLYYVESITFLESKTYMIQSTFIHLC